DAPRDASVLAPGLPELAPPDAALGVGGRAVLPPGRARAALRGRHGHVARCGHVPAHVPGRGVDELVPAGTERGGRGVGRRPSLTLLTLIQAVAPGPSGRAFAGPFASERENEKPGPRTLDRCEGRTSPDRTTGPPSAPTKASGGGPNPFARPFATDHRAHRVLSASQQPARRGELVDNDQDAARFSTGAPPTATYETPVATAPARRGISPAIVAVVAVVALAAGFGAGYAAHGSGTASKKTVTVHGSLTLAQGAYKEGDGTGCTAGDGYSDISPGTAVTIGDDTGATLAVGQLQAGQVTG